MITILTEPVIIFTFFIHFIFSITLHSFKKFFPQYFFLTIHHSVSTKIRFPLLKKTEYEQFYHFAAQILDKNNSLAITRYGDDEFSLIENMSISEDTQAYRVDGFSHRGGDSLLGRDLRLSFTRMRGLNYYYCLGIYANNYHFRFLSKIDQDGQYISSANLFCNQNWPRTRTLFQDILELEKGNIILFCSEKAKYTDFASIIVSILIFLVVLLDLI